MVLPVIAAALPIVAKFLPSLGDLIHSERGAEIAEQVVGVAQAVTGTGNPQDALSTLATNPELVVELQRQATSIELAAIKAETERLQAVNATMQAELSSGDKYVRRWRPTFGYATALAWTIVMIGSIAIIGWISVAEPTSAPAIIIAMGDFFASLIPIWGIALSVLGVSVWKRSEDKKVAAGQSQPGLIGTVLRSITGSK